MKTLLAFLFLTSSFIVSAFAAPLSGTKSVGPTGDYVSLTAAIAAVQAVGNGLGGPLVLELQATYVSTVETFPLTIPALNGASATNTLTIRPASGATALSISSANTTAATVDLNGAQFVTIDGRPGGVGSHAGSGVGAASQLTIANTSTSGKAVRIINRAIGNALRYTTLRSVYVTVFFSNSTGTSGNDDNTIDHCDIRDGASTPLFGIYSFSNGGWANSGNTVSNCNIFNFYSSTTASSAGVRLEDGNTNWTIVGNSIYQTASRAAVAANVYGICILSSIYYSSDNFNVSGNFIGGSAPNAGGTPWTTTGTAAAYVFQGIRLLVGTEKPSNVQGNTIANMVWTSSSSANAIPGVWTGIYVQDGSVNVGTVTGNTVGSGTGTGSISVTTSGNGGTSFGIGSLSTTGPGFIANNTIGSITVNGTSAAISASLTGIQVAAGFTTVSNNTVGSTITANSLNAATSSTSATAQQVTGISSGSASITGNTVANLNNNYAGTATSGQIRGIVGGTSSSGNTVRNLSTTSQNAGAATTASVLGIQGSAVSQNTVHSLANTANTAAVNVTGIYASGTSVIARNLVHSLAVSSPITTSQLNGMFFASGSFTAQNNMVRVGLDASGASTAGASFVRGIVDSSTTAGRNFYHNSVYLGGTQTSGAATSAAFVNIDPSTTRTFQNNIFVNARSSGGTAAGKHYAVQYGGTTVNPTGLTAGGNLFRASGTGGVLGLYNAIDRTSLIEWQTATGQDATSAVADPLFIAPTGTAATGDLHLQASNPAEGGSILLAAVTDDFDGQTRSTLTPVDVGADAGNFTASTDLFPPTISYPLLTNGSTASRVLTGWATITDGVGVADGASAPRLYYKKSTDADVFGVPNNSTGNGWKYVTATGNGPYSFTLDYALLNGGSVTVGNTIQYFVVAQDAANHLGSSPLATATASANPPVPNVNGHGAVNSFNIVPTMSGTVTVGVGGTYPSLSGAGGLFAALNGSVLTGNVVVNITSDLTETGSVTLSQFLTDEYPSNSNYTLTLQPDSATMRTISGSAANGLITLNGADGVTIDGRFGGLGRYLTFRNPSTLSTASTLLFVNDACSNIVRNCVVEGAGTGIFNPAVIFFSTGTVTGNDNNLITGCQVRDLSTAAGVPFILIASNGSSIAAANSGNNVSNNELFNFNRVGIYIASTGNDSWTVSNNSIYEVNAGNNILDGISMAASGTNIITGNFIHDLFTTSGQSYGISFGGTSTTTIARNRIIALNGNAVTTTVVRGISAVGGSGSVLNVVNNQITLSPTAPGSTTLCGLYDGGAAGSVVNVFYNSIVLGGRESSTRNSWAGLRTGASTRTTRGNLFLNLRTGLISSHFAVGSEGTGGSYTASHNVYAGTGATAANFMDFSNYSTVPVSFATWQSSTGETNSQAGVAGSGNFTTAMFVNAASGDLHLVPGGNVLVNALGTPIAGVTIDFDGDPRSATTPTIGADEFVPLSAFSTWAAANGVANDPNALGANGVKNLLNFAFDINPVTGGPGGLQYAGTFAGNGAITATGLPVTMVEGADLRALFVRRKDYIAAGLTYTPQFCADVSAWQDSAAVPVVLADDGVNQIVSVPFPALMPGETGSFFRLHVSLAP